MTTIAYSSVNIQTSTQSVPSIPDWFGEVTLIVSHLHHQGVLADISEQVRFARRRFGLYEVIDFLAVLAGLCQKLRADVGSILRSASTLGERLHGTVGTRAAASPRNAQSLSRRAGSECRRVAAHPLVSKIC